MLTIDRLVERYFGEILNRGDFGAAGEILAPDFLFYAPSSISGLGVEGFARYIQELRTAFSHKEFTELDRLIDGDRAAIRFRMTGIQDGFYHGLPPLGGSIDVEGCDLVRFGNGRIREVRAYFDLMGIMRRLLVPPPIRIVGEFMQQVWSR